MVPAKSVLIDLRTGYVWQPIGKPSGSADRYRVPVRRAEAVAPPMRNILRFIVCMIPCEAMEKTIAPAGRLPLAADRCSFGAGRSIFIMGGSAPRARVVGLNQRRSFPGSP